MAMMPYGWPGRRRRSQDMRTSGTPQVAEVFGTHTFAALGSANAALDAELVTHAILSRVSGHIRSGTQPSGEERQHLLRFCLSAAASRVP
jgi:hypothetical protein